MNVFHGKILDYLQAVLGWFELENVQLAKVQIELDMLPRLFPLLARNLVKKQIAYFEKQQKEKL